MTPTRRPNPATSIPSAPHCLTLALGVLALSACGPAPPTAEPAELVLTAGRVYTFSWGAPDGDGNPAPDAPYDAASGWRPDADAIAVGGDRILAVGPRDRIARWIGEDTRVIDLAGAAVLPGLVDAHTHVAGLGRNLQRIDLRGAETEAEVVERVAAAAASKPPGQWIDAWGWDDSAWGDRYPDWQHLSERVPDHPAILRSLHGFATWGNRLAFEAAGIDRATTDPTGGTIVRDASGRPTGMLLDRAGTLLDQAVPPPTDAALRDWVLTGLQAMAERGYTAIHEAGADGQLTRIFQQLEDEGLLPVRVSLMLSARDDRLLEDFLSRGSDSEGRLVIRSIKAFYDGALGSRGALLLADYSDRPGHRGNGGAALGFNPERLSAMMQAGFQVAIHAIGDAGNRASLDFLERVLAAHPSTRSGRHRIEHAQILSVDDLPRFGQLGVIASMQPPHAVEDMRWAEDRVGHERLVGAYAWRSLRRTGAELVFSSDLPGSDPDFFYGLHAAVTRRNRDAEPPLGWRAEEAVTPEEALRAYAVSPLWAVFEEGEGGRLEPGRRADLTVLRPDPLALPLERYAEVLDGAVEMTIVGGRIVHPRE